MLSIRQQLLTLRVITLIVLVVLESLPPMSLWAAASRPDPPAGFAVATEEGAWVFRPAGDTDSGLCFRVFGPSTSTKSPTEYLLAWVAGRPGPGAFSTPATKPNFSLATRETQIGTRKFIEAGQRDRAAQAADASLRSGTTHSVAARNIALIDSIAFDSVTHVGYGGMLTFDPTPMVMFKSGDVAYMTVLSAPEGLAAHRASYPQQWLHWRREGSAILIGTTQWRRLPYTKTLGPAPMGYRLAGNYQSLSGGGNIAVGGTSGVIAWSNLSFDRGGAFTSGGGSGSFTETNGGDARVATSGVMADQHGSYEVNGYALTLRYASGRVEQRLIVVDPKEPDVVWIDGNGWTRP